MKKIYSTAPPGPLNSRELLTVQPINQTFLPVQIDIFTTSEGPLTVAIFLPSAAPFTKFRTMFLICTATNAKLSEYIFCESHKYVFSSTCRAPNPELFVKFSHLK